MELPQKSASRPQDAAGSDQPPRYIDRSVLIADDDAGIREMLRSLLVSAGYLVFVAASGREALAFCRHLAASLALFDLMIPQGNGLVTCEALRKLPGWGEVPVAILTAACTDQIVRAALRVGVTGFVTKPFLPDDLLQRVGIWTGRSAPPPRRSEPFVWRRDMALDQFAASPPSNVLAWTPSHSEASAPEPAPRDDTRAIPRALHSAWPG
jgi:CheY-like chemotaxis protein